MRGVLLALPHTIPGSRRWMTALRTRPSLENRSICQLRMHTALLPPRRLPRFPASFSIMSSIILCCAIICCPCRATSFSSRRISAACSSGRSPSADACAVPSRRRVPLSGTRSPLVGGGGCRTRPEDAPPAPRPGGDVEPAVEPRPRGDVLGAASLTVCLPRTDTGRTGGIGAARPAGGTHSRLRRGTGFPRGASSGCAEASACISSWRSHGGVSPSVLRGDPEAVGGDLDRALPPGLPPSDVTWRMDICRIGGRSGSLGPPLCSLAPSLPSGPWHSTAKAAPDASAA